MAVVVEAKIELGQCTPLSDRVSSSNTARRIISVHNGCRVYRSCRPRLARQDRKTLYIEPGITLGERIQRELNSKLYGTKS